MFGRSKEPKVLSPKEYAKQLRNQARSGERKRPSPYIGETLDRATAEEKRAYEKAKFFQVYLNQTRGVGLCFDEQEITTCVIDTYDQPERGRCYLVSYNSLDIGEIEIRVGYDLTSDDQDTNEILALYFDLTKLEFLDYREVVGLLQQLALAMLPFGNPDDDQRLAYHMASDYMLEALWNNRHDEAEGVWGRDQKPHLRATGCFTGPAGYYLHSLDYWRKSTDDLLSDPNRDGLPGTNKEI